MWRAVLLLLALAVGVLAVAPMASAQTGGGTLSIGSGVATVGQAVYVNVLASDVPAPGTGAYSIMVQLDPAVAQMRNCTVDHHSTCETPDNRTIVIVGASTEGFTGNWVVAGITFLCTGSGVSPLSVIVHSWGSAIPETVTPFPQIENGTITCAEPTAVPTALSAATVTPAPAVLPSTGEGGVPSEAVPWLLIALLGIGGFALAMATFGLRRQR
jgi:hypothetical protein